MTLSQRIESLVSLGDFLAEYTGETLDSVCRKAEVENPWFTQENIHNALNAIIHDFLQREALENLASHYPALAQIQPKKVALVLAGNIPMVGFHDILCCYIAGHKASIKYSDKDQVLIPWLIEQLISQTPQSADYFERVEKIANYDAAIVTGSDNTARHFAYYLRHVPHIIRKNRTSIAILTGNESGEELDMLGKDIFTYYGLGCRNVSYVWMPENYDINQLIQSLNSHHALLNHNKFKNNYDYNLALYLLNKEPFLQTDSLILRESADPSSRIACLHYSRYKNMDDVIEWLHAHSEKIQCIACSTTISGMETVPLGSSQSPSLLTFADGVDTLAFLCSFNQEKV